MIHEKLYLKDYYSFLGEDGRNPYLETYLPFNLTEMHRENRKRPCMVVCPGGGYGMCSQRESEPVALKFLADGYNVFVINYSVAPHRFPCQLREVAAVMELIYKNADAWNCDTEKIAIIGFSAGGHLAAHYSTMYDCKEVREVFPDSKPVNASVLSYPVISADRDFAHMGSFKNLLGHEPDEQEVKYFSCNNNVRKIHLPHSFGTPLRIIAFRLKTALFMQKLWLNIKYPLSCMYSPTALTVFPPVTTSPAITSMTYINITQFG